MGVDQTMSDFDQMQYQALAVSELTHIIQTKKIPNALLFSGKKNTGKKEAAFFFAKGCNCSSETQIACNNCRSCRKIIAETHPDIIYVAPDQGKKIISISQIRELGVTLSSRPNEARFRMVLILTADRMNIQAQNALLKMLEEPPEKTCFILIATRMAFLLPTIVSRCRHIRFKPLTDKRIEHHLVHTLKTNPQWARIVSKTSDADLEKAMMYLKLTADTACPPWIKKRQNLLDTIAAMMTTDTPRGISNGLMLSQRLSLDPEFMEDAIAIMKTFFRDLIIFSFHPKKIVNLDFFDIFTDIDQRAGIKKRYEWLNQLYETEKRLTSNSTLRLTWDRFFLKLSPIKES